MFIRVQRLKKDTDGKIISGSASLMMTEYCKDNKHKSKQSTIEKLGKVLYLSDDGRSGVFISPTRGLIAYDADSNIFSHVEDGDERLEVQQLSSEPEVHTRFGDCYLVMKHLSRIGMIDVLKDTFDENEYRKEMVHLLHGTVCGQSKVSCDTFYRTSFLPHVISGLTDHELHSDTSYYTMMGSEEVKRSFFRSFILHMRTKYPTFGKCCFVDSTPLPNDIKDNPYNKLSSHGVTETSIQTRLAMVMDIETGFPVWYEIIPGNVLDLSTLRTVMGDVFETLEITIDSFVLDAGYVTKSVIECFNIDSQNEKRIIARMPAKAGYPFKDLYVENKKLFENSKYHFMRGDHIYFGIRRTREIFGKKEYTYVYVDRLNAENYYRNQMRNDDSFEERTMKERNWLKVKGGFFILVSNIEEQPKDMLDRYFQRTDIETLFKTSKMRRLLPLSKWSEVTIKGKILEDIIELIVYNQISDRLKDAGESYENIMWQCGSLYCLRCKNDTFSVETPTKQIKKFYAALNVAVPATVKFKDMTVMMKL